MNAFVVFAAHRPSLVPSATRPCCRRRFSQNTSDRSFRSRNRRGERGSVLTFTMLMLVCSALMGVSYFTLSNTSSLTAYRGAKKTQANLLADAAVQKHYDMIRAYMAQNRSWSDTDIGTLAPTMLISNDDANRLDGTYGSEATLLSQTSTTDTVNKKQIIVSKIRVLGTGTATRTGITSQAYATFTVEQEAPLTNQPLLAFDSTTVIQSNSTITLSTNGGFRTRSTGNHYDGSVLSNGGILWSPQSGSKGSNPNTITFDGQVFAGGNAATSLTNSLNGLLNPNGTVNYQTYPAIAQNGHPIAQINSVTNLGATRQYPDASAVVLWQAGWITQGRTGTTYGGSVSTNSAPSVNGERRITAPAYISGDLNSNSNQLYLQPSSDSSKSNVVYVAGNITNSALLYNRGVLLVAAGKYTATNSSAQYALTTSSSPYTMAQLYAKTALVTLSPTSDAIDMGVNAASETGLIYACLGGIKCLANNNFNGALVAGGAGLFGGIIAGGPNSFDITFTPGALQNRTEFMFNPSALLGGGSTQPGAINKTTVNDLGQFVWGR